MDLLTQAEAGREARVCVRTIFEWRKAGLPFIRTGATRGRVLIDRADLERYYKSTFDQ